MNNKITISYKNEANGQTMTATADQQDDGGYKVAFSFDPSVKDETRDPFGLMAGIIGLFNPGDDEEDA